MPNDAEPAAPKPDSPANQPAAPKAPPRLRFRGQTRTEAKTIATSVLPDEPAAPGIPAAPVAAAAQPESEPADEV